MALSRPYSRFHGRPDRRLLLGAAVALSGLAMAGSWTGVTGADSAIFTDGLRAAFSQASSLGAFGRLYFARFADEANVTRLSALLFGPGGPPSGALDDWLAARSQADFDRGDVTRVGGWVLSRTEARLCAYASLVVADVR